jgi:hypothetical protein
MDNVGKAPLGTASTSLVKLYFGGFSSMNGSIGGAGAILLNRLIK